MAYDRYDPRDDARGERPRWSDDRFEGRDRDPYDRSDRGGRHERGFFERAGDEIASWFGGDDDDRRPRDEHMRRERDYRRAFGRDDRGPARDWRPERERGYRPLTGDYGAGRDRGDDRWADERARGPWGRDEYRRTSYAGSSERGGNMDPNYHAWRERRSQKRGLLAQIREHMEVVGNDDEHLGTVDKIAGDRIILAKSDPDSGGAHHSLSCSDIDRIEGDRVILDCSADEARHRWRDENRSRALFEREDQGEIGPRVLDRSFEGTYRR
jgi:hypothetical protein